MRLLVYITLGLAMIGVIACQSAAPEPTPPTSAFTSPLEAPTASVFTSPIPAPPAADLAAQPAVAGVLLRGGETPVPVSEVILYLGEIHLDENGTPLVAGLDRQTAPRTQTDVEGRFAFYDAPPGTYVLILDLIYESFLLNDPITGGDFLLEVEPDQTLDLGNLVYNSLPGDGPLP